MRSHEASQHIARSIVDAWIHTERNHFIVVPSLNHSSVLFDLLRHPDKLRVPPDNEVAAKLAIAFCPHGLVHDAHDLVRVACDGWGVTVEKHHDYRRQLLTSISTLVQVGRKPVLLLPGFHRIVLDLPEELGSVLRDLNQHSGLLCVAEVPLKWTTLVERWRNEGRTGLISSGFGQGYRHEFLGGYDTAELAELLSAHDLPGGYLLPMFDLTGGFHSWVEQLLDEARRGAKPPAWKELLITSVAFQNFLNYLDTQGASANRAAIARLFHGIATMDDRAALEGHDWAVFLLDRNGSLTSSAIGAGCAQRLEVHSSQDFEKAVIRLIRSGSYSSACEVIERAGRQHGLLRHTWLIAQILNWVNSGLDEWARVLRALNELEETTTPSPSATDAIAIWKDFVGKMLTCSKAQPGGRSPDPIGYLCGSGTTVPAPLTALRLISARLTWVEHITSPYLATVAILNLPEALIQVYCAIKLDLKYWAAPALDDSALSKIRLLPQREAFQWPAPDGPLQVGQLITIGWQRMEDLHLLPDERLANSFSDLDRLQQFYTQYRNPLAHRLTTINENHATRYVSLCRQLLTRVATILCPSVPLTQLGLPPLEDLLEAPAEQPPAPAVPKVSPNQLIADKASKVLQLNHLLLSRLIPGGLSGASVHIVEFRDGDTAPIHIGVLKVTTKPDDFEREMEGMKNAQACWLQEYIASQLRCATEGNTGYILSPLAFRATKERRIDSFHDLLASGEKTRARVVARRLGEIYGRVCGELVTSKSTRPGTPQQHFNRVWAHWQHAATGLDWKGWGFPARAEQSFADGKRNWINPLACLDDVDCWREKSIMSLAWGWQHRDLNARNVLVEPSQHNNPQPLALELRFIDLEKVSESSAFLDICWVSFWALLAGADRGSTVQEQTWDQLPGAFIYHSLGRFDDTSCEAPLDCGMFQLSLDCISEAFTTIRADGHLIGDPIMLSEMAALTIAGASLAKAFYELRDLQRVPKTDSRLREPGYQKARCFFRIAARALERFVVQPHGPFLTDISLPILEQ